MKYIFPLLQGNMISLDVCEIKYLQSDRSIVYIVTDEDNKFVGNQPLKFYAELLSDEMFFQINQSVLVNTDKIRYIDAVNKEVEMKCGHRLTMSRNGFKALKEFIKERDYRWN